MAFATGGAAAGGLTGTRRPGVLGALLGASMLAPVVAGAAPAEHARGPAPITVESAGGPGSAALGGVGRRLRGSGLNQTKLNVTIDGVPQRYGVWRNHVWRNDGALTLDPMFLLPVEVRGGVAPADMGFGALNGALGFRTKAASDLLRPGQTVGGTLIMGDDTNPGTKRVTAAGYGAADGFEALAVGTAARGDDYETGDGRAEMGTATEQTNGLGKLAWTSPEGRRLELSAVRTRDAAARRLRANAGLVANANPNFVNPTTATRTVAVARYAVSRPQGLFNPAVTLYFSRNEVERPNIASLSRPHGAFNTDVRAIGGTVQNTFMARAGNLAVGVDVHRDEASVERFHFATDADERIAGAGAFAQARLAPMKRLRVSGGLRIDHQSYRAVDGQTFDGAGVSPNLSAEADIPGGLTAFAGFSHVWGGLEMAETAMFHTGDFRYAPDLDPVTARNLRGGLRWAKDGLLLESAVFRTRIMNPTDWNVRTRTRINGPDLTSEGFELIAGRRWANAGVRASFTRADVAYGDRMALPSDHNTANAVGDVIGVAGFYTIESLNLTIGGFAEIARDLESADLRAAGFGDLKGYEVVDLFVEWAPTPEKADWTLRLEANNVFDDAYAKRSNYGQQGARIDPILAPGRSVLLTTTLRF